MIIKKKLIVVAHPYYEDSKIIKKLIEGIQSKAVDTDVHILNANGNFNIAKEQEILLKYQVITFAFPFWWYTTPWILNKYLSDVMTPGFAFSFKGKIHDAKLRGKKFSYLVTVGNVEKTFHQNEVNLFTVEHYLSHLNGWFHMAATGWPADRTLKAKTINDYMIAPIVCYGSAVEMIDLKIWINEYIKKIDTYQCQ